MSGKAIKDIVLIPINQIARLNISNELSIIDDNSSRKHEHTLSYAFESTT